ncbi:MAG: class I SAM-dependent methyltransferase [Ferruginibacter sp.]
MKKTLNQFWKKLRGKEKDAATAYNLWAGYYDSQPHNLMLALDETVFSELLQLVPFTKGLIADIGCGTGRHWQKLLQLQPQKITGFDVSEQMLAKLVAKYPGAETHLVKNESLAPLQDNSCGLLVSTLTIAHIENMHAALKEWARVVAPGAYIIITDYHPAALAKGAQRTFTANNEEISIKNYVHPVEQVIERAKQLNLSVIRLTEKIIDENMLPYYEQQSAVHVFEKWKGTPVIYGLLLQKADVAQ